MMIVHLLRLIFHNRAVLGRRIFANLPISFPLLAELALVKVLTLCPILKELVILSHQVVSVLVSINTH